MKKLLAVIPAFVLTLGLCACVHTPNVENTASSVTSFVADITGDVLCDSKVSVEVPEEAGGIVSCQWYVGGRPLQGATDHTLHIPATAGEKKLKVVVQTQNGTAESDEITIQGTEGATRSMAGLYYDIKIIGRCVIAGDIVTADFSGSGFEMNLNIAGGDVKLDFFAGQNLYLAVYVDGELVDRPYFKSGQQTLTIPVPRGDHTLKVLKETEITGPNINLQALTFDGQVLDRPDDKELFIEFIGDSISCGDGALGTYTAGQAWSLEDHSATNAFPYYTAQALDADYSVVARGGIGLVNKVNGIHMLSLYPRANVYRSDTPYVHHRTTDIAVIALSSNDKKHGVADFRKNLEAMIDMLRSTHGADMQIVWLGQTEEQYDAALEIIKEREKTDSRLHALFFDYGGSGSAALATQTEGHPNAAEQKELSDALVKFLKEKGIV